MFGLAGVAFLSPLWLGALAALPVLWWLLRVTPPAPRRLTFPAIRILLALRPKEETPAQTPLWLLILRLIIAGLMILALSHPLLNPGARVAGGGPLLLVVDDSWAAARNWKPRQELIIELIDKAERNGQAVMLLPTAPSVDGEAPRASRLAAAGEARSIARALEPKPWPADRIAARAALDTAALQSAAVVEYVADGLADDALAPFLERLQRLGGVEYIADPDDRLARVLAPPAPDAAGLGISVLRPATGDASSVFVRATGDDGRLLALEEFHFAAGQTTAGGRIALPSELRNRVARLEIEGEASAAATVLMDERWRRRPVGLVSGVPIDRQQPLLGDVYYLERALSPFSEVRTGAIGELLQRELAVLVLADSGRLTADDMAAIDPWMKKGGMVVRFAGPRMADGGDDFVPAPLRGGGRSFGGAMSWAQPATLANFDPAGPFAGLAIPDDLKIMRQVLAEPSLDLSDKTWARLSDGTPLITADRRGDGWLVLVHTSATPDWSNLPLSGLFVEILQRLVARSQGVAGDSGDNVLPPLSSLDGFGRLQAPSSAALGLPAREVANAKIGPKYPPGYYGAEFGRRALNLSATLPPPHAAGALPAGVQRRALEDSGEIDAKPALLIAALMLALADLVISLVLRGLIGVGAARRAAARRAATAALLLLAVCAAPASLHAQNAPRPQPTAPRNDDAALTGTLQMRLAYIRTGRPEIDGVSRAGLVGLGAVLARRTAIDAGQPSDLDIETDELAFFPLIYWPIAAEGPAPTPAAMNRVNLYLREGGMILFDTRDADRGGGQTPNAQRLRDILRQISLPALTPVPPDHVLTKSFYLLQQFPGRWTGQPVWVEESDSRVNDGVSSVVVGAHDWAAAWAIDAQGRPQYAVLPGGEPQRETAIRFGVNIVMYALTGNYKADQVHVDAVLERLKK